MFNWDWTIVYPGQIMDRVDRTSVFRLTQGSAPSPAADVADAKSASGAAALSQSLVAEEDLAAATAAARAFARFCARARAESTLFTDGSPSGNLPGCPAICDLLIDEYCSSRSAVLRATMSSRLGNRPASRATAAGFSGLRFAAMSSPFTNGRAAPSFFTCQTDPSH